MVSTSLSYYRKRQCQPCLPLVAVPFECHVYFVNWSSRETIFCKLWTCSFANHGNFEAMKMLSCCRVSRWGKNQFCAIKLWWVLEPFSSYSQLLNTVVEERNKKRRKKRKEAENKKERTRERDKERKEEREKEWKKIKEETKEERVAKIALVLPQTCIQ